MDIEFAISLLSIGLNDVFLEKRLHANNISLLNQFKLNRIAPNIDSYLFGLYTSEIQNTITGEAIMRRLLEMNSQAFANNAIKKLISNNTTHVDRFESAYIKSADFVDPKSPIGAQLGIIRENCMLYTHELCVDKMVAHVFLYYTLADVYIVGIRKEEPQYEDLKLKNAPKKTPIQFYDSNGEYSYSYKYQNSKNRTIFEEKGKFRPARWKAFKPPDEETNGELLKTVRVYVIWEYFNKNQSITIKKSYEINKRISGLCAWKLYDKHPLYGKHAYLEILCARMEYLDNVTEKKPEDKNDLTDDSINEFFIDSISYGDESNIFSRYLSIGNTIYVGTKDTESKQESKKYRVLLPGLASICRWEMFYDCYQMGYKRIILSVIQENEESEAHATIKRYKQMGFSIIADKIEIDSNVKGKEFSTNQFVMTKVLKKRDMQEIVTKCVNTIGLDTAIKDLKL